MNKAEMEDHAETYQSLLGKAKAAEKGGRFAEVIDLCIASCEHIDGMMQYERKYQNREFAGVLGIDLVLRYAPLLFDNRSLDEIGALLKDSRRIERDTSDDMGAKLARARQTMWNAHRLWNHLEANPGTRQDELRNVLGSEQEEWTGIAEAWAKMEVLERSPEDGNYRLTLWTRMDQPVESKCASCGSTTSRPKSAFLESLRCPVCQSDKGFVLLANRAPSTKE